MGSEWRETTWGEEVSLEYGKALRGYDAATGGFRVFGSNGPIGWTDKPLAAGPGVILGRKGAYRGVEFSRDPFWVIDTAYYLKPKSEFDMRWLYYAVLHHKLGEIDDGSPIPSTTRAAVYAQGFLVPPITEQRAIAAVLGSFDDRIENLRQTNATLEAIAQALFKSWFVDFDPVRAKAEGREPEGMEAASAALFPSEFEDSELGPIPKGWRPVAFGDVATLSKGTINPMSSPEQEFQHYSLPAFDASQLPLTELGEAIKSNKTPVPPGAVLVSKLNPHIPRVWYVGDTGPHAVCSTEFLVWMPKPDFGNAFLYTLAASPAFNTAMRQLVTGTSNSHQRVRPAQLAEVRAAVISNDALARFEATVAPMLQQVVHNRRRAAALAEARDTLLPRLISGKLRLPEAEREIEAVTA